jgi:hypothetical protein
MYVGARLGRIDSAEFIARMGDWFRKWSSLFSTSNINKKETPSAQWTINCACASARAISCTRSSPGPDYCLQASCFDDGGLSSVLSGRLNFLFLGQKYCFRRVSLRLQIKERKCLLCFWTYRFFILFKQFRDVVLGYSHIESMWNKRSQPLRSVLDCEEPGEVEECIQVYLKTKSQVLVVSSKAST